MLLLKAVEVVKRFEEKTNKPKTDDVLSLLNDRSVPSISTLKERGD